MRPALNNNIKKAPILLLSLCLLLVGCGKKVGASSFNSTRYTMGTVVSMELYLDREKLPEQNADEELSKTGVKAFERFEEIARQTDRYDAAGKSDVLLLEEKAGQGQAVAVGKDVFYLIKQVKNYQYPQVDLTLGPVIDLWNKAREEKKLPEPADLKEAMNKMGMEKVHIDDEGVYLEQEGMSLDFGAVAKGYALEEAWKVFKESGLPVYGIINAGGNVKTVGSKPDGTPWKIGLTDPNAPNELMGTLILNADEAVATSGDYQRYFEIDGVRYHHLLDPATGYPRQEYRSVTVVTASGFVSDYFSTLLFLTPVDEALALVEESSELEAFFVTRDNKVYVSSGLKDRINWTFQGGYTLVAPR